MKTNKLWSIMMMLVLVFSTMVSFSSCSKDDDEYDGGNNGGSSIASAIVGKTFVYEEYGDYDEGYQDYYTYSIKFTSKTECTTRWKGYSYVWYNLSRPTKENWDNGEKKTTYRISDNKIIIKSVDLYGDGECSFEYGGSFLKSGGDIFVLK